MTTAQEMLAVVDEFLATAPLGEAQKVYAVLTALRGPDDGDVRVKWRTTAKVRTRAFPRTAVERVWNVDLMGKVCGRPVIHGNKVLGDTATLLDAQVCPTSSDWAALLAPDAPAIHFLTHLWAASDVLWPRTTVSFHGQRMPFDPRDIV